MRCLNQLKTWSSHLLDNLSNCLLNLKNSGDSTGFEPMTSAMPVQCSNQLSYEVTQLRAGQYVGLMFSRERNVVWKNIPTTHKISPWPNQWFTAKRRLDGRGQSLTQMTIKTHASCSSRVHYYFFFLVMSPTTSSGKLFHTWTAVWKVRPVETVLDISTARAWHGIDMLEQVALLTK